MQMEIRPEDPRAHFEKRTYTRALVPGTVPDVNKRYTSINFRPDELVFSVQRTHSSGVTGQWALSSIHLRGWRVLKSGKVSQTEGQHYSDQFDMEHGIFMHPAPVDVVEYVRVMVDSLNMEKEG